jgi:2-polyprenyl-6-methoxyphenol hydroxylase-like FAD-dependent oxidoreductase
MKPYDLIVAGGGTAGALSAIAASRCGLRTAVIERGSCLGGNMTISGLTEMNAPTFHGQPIYHGIEAEIMETMIRSGDAALHIEVPFSSNPSVKVDRLRYNPEILKILLDRMAGDAGVEIRYGAEIRKAEREDAPSGGVRLTVQDNAAMPGDSGAADVLSARYLIDATGSAAVIRMLGGETTRAAVGKTMVNTLMFRLSDIDQDALDAFVHSAALAETIQLGLREGVLAGKIMAFTPIPGTGDVSVNVTRTSEDFEDPAGMSRALVEARAQILPILRFIRARVPGLERASLAGIAPILGIRDTRTIRADYCLSIDDLERMTEFEDTIARGCYPVDIHDPATGGVVFQVLPGVYHIPYRSLIPTGMHRTLAAGKILCCDRKAYGAVRVMPIMMNVGESAGYAAACAAVNHLDIDRIPADTLSAFLAEKYHGPSSDAMTG